MRKGAHHSGLALESFKQSLPFGARASLDLEDLDIAAPSVDLRKALAERSTQITNAQSGVSAAEGQSLHAPINTHQIP